MWTKLSEPRFGSSGLQSESGVLHENEKVKLARARYLSAEIWKHSSKICLLLFKSQAWYKWHFAAPLGLFWLQSVSYFVVNFIFAAF